MSYINAQDPTALYTPPVSNSDNAPSVHLLDLARTLPIAAISSGLNGLYRSLTSFSHAHKDHWLYLRFLAYRSLASTITTAPPTKSTPQSLWSSVLRCCTSWVDSSKTSKKDKNGEARDLALLSEEIRQLIFWVERCISSRNDKRERWFVGKDWTSLMDLWIALARKASD
jgi:hypothetical protein